ncbi:MAG: BMP family ABC transporter substrate-binding protein [Nitrospinota bacterium]|nr:MAG: BMP family ABC transporter substrate-binding protein [Nitrospinota bacterium]
MWTTTRLWGLGIVLLTLTLGFSLLSPLAAQGAQDNLCIVFDIGGRGDLSFNDMAALGGEKAVQAGLASRVIEVQSKSEADYLPNLRTLARSRRCMVIVGVGFLLTDAVKAVAEEFPTQPFAIIDGFIPDRKNVLSLLFKENEGSALVGALAAMLATEFNASAVGIVLGVEIPVLWKFECGYKFGVHWALTQKRRTRPDAVKVLATYTGSFNDPARGKTAAEVQLNQGAIVIYNVAGATGLGIFEAVEARGKAAGRHQGPPFAIGVDADQDYIKPGFIVASMMKRVDVGVFTAARLAHEGKFQGGILELGLEQGGIAVSKVEDLEQFLRLGISAGTVKPEDRTQIISRVKAMRDALPPSVFAAVTELEEAIKSQSITVPKPFSAQEIEACRKRF